MEPRKIETPVQPRGEGQTSPPRQPERKRRFQLIKLEERIAPGGPLDISQGTCKCTLHQKGRCH
jgi:hypothetical protein